MSTLPLDIYQEIFRSLDAQSLDSCSSVNHSFHRMAQQHQFEDVLLNSASWKAKCQFLEGKGLTLRSRVRKLRIEVEGIDLLASADLAAGGELEDMFTLMREVGPQLRTFILEGKIINNSHYGHYARSMSWSQLALYFRSQLFVHIIPHIQTLEIFELRQIPILDILNKTSQLRRLLLSASRGLIAQDSLVDHLATIADLDLAFGAFNRQDFDVSRYQRHYLHILGSHVTSLELQLPINEIFPSDLFFLEPFDNLKAHLKHLRLWIRLYDCIMSSTEDAEHIPLNTFKSLETLTFSVIAGPQLSHWLKWFTIWYHWIKSSAASAPKCFRKLQFTVETAKGAWSDQGLPSEILESNDLSPVPTFDIDIVGSSSSGTEDNEKMFAFIRSLLFPWEKVGMLKFWVKLGEIG
ncbi:hypothetical protein DL96DRAFT_1810879 [Flagelloscypha sp. PMI_526]|nr:hypothetical protein DL96DRAFT_1810879 [Flagelloscypha sp. PMI_526]